MIIWGRLFHSFAEGGCISVFCVHFPQYWSDSVQNWRLTGSGTFQKDPSSPTSLLASKWSKSRLRHARTATFGKWMTRSNGRRSFLAVCMMFRGATMFVRGVWIIITMDIIILLIDHRQRFIKYGHSLRTQPTRELAELWTSVGDESAEWWYLS